jgi:hypothetical protein
MLALQAKTIGTVDSSSTGFLCVWVSWCAAPAAALINFTTPTTTNDHDDADTNAGTNDDDTPKNYKS